MNLELYKFWEKSSETYLVLFSQTSSSLVRRISNLLTISSLVRTKFVHSKIKKLSLYSTFALILIVLKQFFKINYNYLEKLQVTLENKLNIFIKPYR